MKSTSPASWKTSQSYPAASRSSRVKTLTVNQESSPNSGIGATRTACNADASPTTPARSSSSAFIATLRSAYARTLVWNGPLGAFEIEPFDKATVAAARHAAANTKAGKLLTVAGGGDTVSALNHAGVADDFTYISTAGGAFLEWLEGKALPGVECLRKA